MTTVLLLFQTINLLGQSNVRIIESLSNDNMILLKNKKFGFSKDTASVDFVYDSLLHPHLEKYLFAKKNGYWGVIDLNEKTIIPFDYQLVERTWYNNFIGIDTFIVQKNQKLGTVDFNNQTVIHFEYDAISGWVEYGPEAHYVLKNGKFGLIKHSGKEIIPTIYDSLYFYSNKIIKGKLNGKFGILNISNQVVIPFHYDALIVDFNSGYLLSGKDHFDKFAVKKNNKWVYINYNGKLIQDNISQKVIEEDYAQYEISNYDFQYIVHCLIKVKKQL